MVWFVSGLGVVLGFAIWNVASAVVTLRNRVRRLEIRVRGMDAHLAAVADLNEALADIAGAS